MPIVAAYNCGVGDEDFPARTSRAPQRRQPVPRPGRALRPTGPAPDAAAVPADRRRRLAPQAAVLDVGTGPGLLLVEIARLRPDLQLTGLDLAPDMVETARHNLAGLGDRATAVVGDVSDLPFEDDSFDLIVSSLSLHHWADPATGGVELTRVLRTGGQVRIYDVRSAPFAALRAATSGPGGDAKLTPFPITPLPRPALRRLVLRPVP
jgi:ubiquinone/menaquinone biosynthesis C-methylase UbiE